MEPAPSDSGVSTPIEHTLSAISTTSATITRFIRSVRAAHGDLSAVTRELSDLRLALELLRDETGIPVGLQSQLLVLLDACRDTLVRINIILAQCPDTAQWASGPSKGEVLRQQE